MVNIWSVFGHMAGTVCPLCRAAGDGICLACRETLPRNPRPCPGCALPLPDSAAPGTLCADCQRRPPAFDSAVAPLLYLAPVDDLVAGFKYHHRLDLGRTLADMLAATVAARSDRPQLLLPIPAAPRRLAERGFNQSAELARQLSRALDIPWSTDRLVRIVDRGPQRGANRRARRRNVRGSFACRGGVPDRVALIDDVITTGATADAAAGLLKRAGARRVEVWAVARTPLGGWL